MKLADAVQGPEEKHMDPHVVLDKILRLDRKYTNFDFLDVARNVHFRVQYPAPLNDSPPNEHLLRQFWRHCHNFYFRTPEQSEIGRLDYLSDILDSEVSPQLPLPPNRQFWKDLEMVFTQEYGRNRLEGLGKDLDSQNWFYILYLYYALLENEDNKPAKKIEKELSRLKDCKRILKPISSTKLYQESLKSENAAISRLLPSSRHDGDQVSRQIREFENELQENHKETVRLFSQLQGRVSQELQENRQIYFFGEQEHPIKQLMETSSENSLLQRIFTINCQLDYLEYTINRLEKKQIAESISKIVRLERTRGDYKFHVSFEEAMNVKKKTLSQRQLMDLNKNRQYSLFKFYNTSLKTPHSFICQNFYGFREIHLHRNQPCKLQNKDILDEIKKVNVESAEVNKSFQKFDICHHCKLLYSELFLTKCKYSSQKMGIPIQPPPYSDSYISQISKIESSKSQRYSLRRRNCFQNYTKINSEYVCNRKFCKYCLKQNYECGLDKNGLCPFCQGVCFCTRCARNDMIVKLKSIYLLLGGEVSKFEDDKFLEYQSNETDEEETNSVRKKGRPKKIVRKSLSAPNKSCDRKNVVRMQLEPLRLLCDMIKKREKIKMRNYENEHQMFYAKLGFYSKQLVACRGQHPQPGQRQSLDTKFAKKLNRMI